MSRLEIITGLRIQTSTLEDRQNFSQVCHFSRPGRTCRNGVEA